MKHKLMILLAIAIAAASSAAVATEPLKLTSPAKQPLIFDFSAGEQNPTGTWEECGVGAERIRKTWINNGGSTKDANYWSSSFYNNCMCSKHPGTGHCN